MTNQTLNTLNSEQLVALKAIDGPVLVTAGAGSGKTRLLTHRIAYLLENLGVLPDEILAITFTNKAAAEMKSRVANLCQNGKNVWISTFHSMCMQILRVHIGALDARFNRNFSIYADAESTKVVKTLLAEENIADDKLQKKILFHLSNMKNNNIPLSAYKEELAYERDASLIARIMVAYQTTLTNNNALDFDDLLMKTYELFCLRPDILNTYARRFRYILVDEFQDTNILQYDIIKKLASVHGNVFVVGDEDQCIYTWRGANFKNIANFCKDFPATQIFKLEQNYRSTKTILNTANQLIKKNTQRINKTLWSDNAEGEPIEFKSHYDEQEEASYVASTIHNLVQNHGFSYGDFAILLRLNALSFPFEEKLLAYNIPHKIYGGFKFYERAEIKNVLAYLKLFINPQDEQAFIRIINFPKRGIGEVSVSKICELAKANGVSCIDISANPSQFGLTGAIVNKLADFANTYLRLLAQFEQTPLDEFCKNVVDAFGIKKAFDDKKEEDLDKLLNIDQLLHSVQNFALQNPFDGLGEYLQSVSLISDIDSMGADENVIVATVHAVKGLEFRAVFLPALEEGVFPISRAQGQDEQMEEERRLMYVGITRAKEKLFVSACKTRFLYGNRKYQTESRFIGDAGLARRIDIFANKPTPNNFDQNKFSGLASQINSIKSSNFAPSASASNKALDYSVGQKVCHPRFGNGLILQIDEEERTADIDFDVIGVKTLMLDIAPLTKLEN